MRYLNRLARTLSVITILVFFLTGCAVRQGVPIGVVPPPVAPLPEAKAQTRSMVEAHVDQNHYKFMKSPAKQKRVENIVNRLTRAAGGQGFVYPVYLVDAGDEVNAMAINGNTIVVYNGILDKVPQDDQLATILGHEIAHILAGHNFDNGAEKNAAAVSMGSSLLGLAASVGASAAGMDYGTANLAGSVTESVTGVVGTGAFVRSYDRSMESEADHIGMMIMAKAGYDPHAALTLWTRANDIFGSGGEIAFLSTHPSSSTRLKDLEAALPTAEVFYNQASKPVATAKVSKPAKAVKK